MQRRSVGRHLAAILAADVAGYARLMGEDEEGTLAALRLWRREIAEPLIRDCRGRIVKSTGDGFLVEFASVVDAVRCAVDMQRRMAQHNGSIAAERRVEFRIGINLGDIVAEDHDIYGDGVNVAARLEALSEPGGICVSEVVRDQVRDRLRYAFDDRGEHQVKNIARPVRVYAIGPAAIAVTEPADAPAPRSRLAGLGARSLAAGIAVVVVAGLIAGWWLWRSGLSPQLAQDRAASMRLSGVQGSVPRLSIVLLPLENLSHDPDQDYFADAITEDLTTDLSRIAGSFVIARNTAFTYKGKSVDVRQLGRDLGVRYVLEGSVRRLGNQVQVNVQLIDADSGAHVWADRFETDRRNLTDAQSEITGRLARTLNLELVQAEARRLEQERHANPDARDLVMRGAAIFQREPGISNRQEGQRYFEHALEIDPNLLDAKLWLATALVVGIADGGSEAPQADEEKAERLVNEMLLQDPNRSQLHGTIALLRRMQNRLPESRSEWERAIALDPNNSIAYGQLGVTLLYLGEPAATIPLEEKRIRLNPNDPNIAVAYWSMGLAYLLQGKPQEALEWLTRARAANPRVYYYCLDLAAAMALTNDLDGAHGALADALRLKPEISSIKRQRARWAYTNNPAYRVLAEKTVDAGLRLAGMPEE
ncbi:MAG TPA: adenylate/guanylate cyclase domain-containing protein [Stellaceae bacterium]|nr:adenylate/guanylate cyclase domain-containing protein [Stellaceae bacterium]